MRATARLTDSAVVLAAGDAGRICRCSACCAAPAGRMPPAAPVLEVNPRHPLIEALGAKVEDKALIEEAAPTLLDLARVQEGDLPRDPADFARRITHCWRAA